MFQGRVSEEDTNDITELKALEHPSMRTDFYPLMWHAAKDALVYNRDGGSWIDFTSAIAVANSGHSNQDVVNALKASLEEPLFATYSFPHRYRLRLVKKLERILKDSTGESYGIHFMSSGTEAVESAVNIALNNHDQEESVVVSFYNAFHGNTLQSDSISGTVHHSYFTTENGRRIHYVKLPFQNRKEARGAPFGKVISDALGTCGLSVQMVAGIVVELYQGKGVFVARQEFIEDIRAFCNTTHALFIIDEIQSGFYRTAKRFAFEHFGITPDIICLGKGLTSSLPMSAVAVKRDLFDKSSNLDIATTHSASPMSCIAAIANIDFMENEAFRRELLDLSDEFRVRIHGLAAKHSNVISFFEVFGMAAGLHITVNERPSRLLAERIARRCFEGGLILSMPNGPHKSYLRVTPPLVIKKDVLNKGMQILDNALGGGL